MRPKFKIAILVIALGLIWVGGALAQVLVPPAQFDMTGFIQEATVAKQGTTVTDPILFGGTLTINGIKMIVPDNSIVQMPAASFTWAQLFDPAVSVSVPPGRPNHAAGQTGLALVDTPRMIPSCEIRVVGNVLTDQATGAQKYVVGLIVPISQELFNALSGIVTYINYNNGTFRVGGVPGNPNLGALVQFNDPVGRWGKPHSPDQRFTSDTNNPTVSTVTGYPLGIPRVAPPASDSRCPLKNRPLNDPLSVNPNQPFDPYLAAGAPLRTWTMPAPGAPATAPDVTKQVPLMVGDWVDIAGTLFKQNPSGPNTAANMFISAHTVVANLGVYTQPGITPAYINSSVLIGAAGGTVVNGFRNPPTGIPQEASTRIVVEGFCTDHTNIVDFYAIDVDPVSGAETERLLGSALPEDGVLKLRPKGRYRFIVGKGAFTPVTREYIAKTRTGASFNVANMPIAGVYRLPCFDYIVPEATVMGNPIVPSNFQDFLFLSQGSGPLNGTGPIIGRLDPWPGDSLPPAGAAVTATAAPAAVDAALADPKDTIIPISKGRSRR